MILTKKQIVKIILLLICIIIFNFVFPIHSNAGFVTGILTRPICYIVVSVTDGVNMMLSSLLIDPITNAEEFWKAIENNTGLDIFFQAKNSHLMSPDRIFNGESHLLDANIFNAPTYTGKFEGLFNSINNIQGYSIASALKKSVSNIYVVLRNISAVILLCLLIYTGIKILISNVNPYEQAQWKAALIDWVKALFSLVLMHFLMIGIFYISDLIVDSLKTSFGDISFATMIRNAYSNNSFWDDTEAIVTTIMYAYITYLSVVFAIAYFKRLTWVVILIVISPIVAVTQALGKQKGIFSKWLKEYTFTVLLQPFHMLIFFILVGIPLGLIGNNVQNVDFLSRFEFKNTNFGIYVYILIAISLIRPAEKFMYGLFGFNESQVAKQGTSESGVKVIKQVEKVVKDVAKVVVGVGAAIATGGASAAANAASGASAAANAASGAVPPVGGNLPLGDNGEPVENALLDSSGGIDEIGNSTLDQQIAATDGELNNLHSNADMLIDSGKMDDDMMQQFANKETELTSKKNGLLSAREERERTNKDNDSSSAAKDLKDAADELKDAAKQLEEYNVSDTEFNNALGEEKPKNRLMSRLEEAGITSRVKAGFDYLTSPEGLDNLNDLRGDLGGLRDTMYLDGAPGEYNQGAFGVDSTRKEIDAKKKGNVTAYVNNQNNIDYMKQEHGLNDKEAKARLEAGAPYINRGITDVATIDRLITLEQKTGKSPDRVMIGAAKEQRHQVKVENTINDQSKISAVSQIIARQTGEKADSPRVQQAARETMQQAKPYVEAGKTDPQIIHRLVQLESNLKNHKIAAGSRTPAKVMQMDKVIDKAMKEGFKKIKLPEGSAGMQQIEKAMNKELKDRIAINAPKKESTKK